MRRGFKTWAENQAKEQRHKLDLKADAPLPARQLASWLKIPIFGPEQMTRNVCRTSRLPFTEGSVELVRNYCACK